MKKVLLPVLFALFFAAPTFAQVKTSSISPEIEKKCTRITQVMAQELRLTEMGYIQLKAINCERIVKTEALQAAYGNNERVLREKMEEVESAYEKGIAAILTAKQLEAYAEFREESSQTVFVASTEKK
ncbi:hypothetical protein ACFS7Z_14460 [Pontibacter toksunensis]|uniref:Uncharacterized protein n=1 Tax=Pontibacter toksunensis TaxID=1332631 RepID=A0ABW6BW76_9BACT